MTEHKIMEINVTLEGIREESDSLYTSAISLKEMESLNNACMLRYV